jgi:hypothetical protein
MDRYLRRCGCRRFHRVLSLERDRADQPGMEGFTPRCLSRRWPLDRGPNRIVRRPGLCLCGETSCRCAGLGARRSRTPSHGNCATGLKRRSGWRTCRPMLWRSTGRRSLAGSSLRTRARPVCRHRRSRSRAAGCRHASRRGVLFRLGVRTAAVSAARYNPMSYHNGSVWPHDNAVIALSLPAMS